MLREEVPQVAETYQEANTLTHDVTDVGVPGKVSVKEHKVSDTLALLNGPATDPHADRRKVTGVLSGAEEKDFRFGCVEFKSVCMEPRC